VNHTILFALIAFAGSLAVAALVRRYATSLKVIDIPNDRSLHSQPKPRGGGLGIACFGLIGVLGAELGFWKWLLLGASLLVALIGWIDDSGGLRARIRLVVHSIAALMVLGFLPDVISLHLGLLELSGVWLLIPAFLMIVWMLNLYNFMDGIDGLAGAEAIIGGAVLSVLSYYLGARDLALIYLTIASASLGFLCLNWPPAKIFMGDVGSGFLGFVFGALAIRGEITKQLPLSASLAVFGFFVVDSGITLIRRQLRGEKVYEAHRKHAYQKAVQKGYSHRHVTISIILVNLLWLAPFAALCVWNPQWQLLYIFVAYLPLAWKAYKLGAGT
jgi:Fuc2NAc and GlcNAc transferase